jgi:hypothetical protein
MDVVDGLGFDGELIVVAAQGEPMHIFSGQLLGERRSIRGWTVGRQKLHRKKRLILVFFPELCR